MCIVHLQPAVILLGARFHRVDARCVAGDVVPSAAVEAPDQDMSCLILVVAGLEQQRDRGQQQPHAQHQEYQDPDIPGDLAQRSRPPPRDDRSLSRNRLTPLRARCLVGALTANH
jgi:hypothetical protein